MGRPRLEISAVQVVATVLAAVTGALLASYLGVVGTIAGTAIASAASTTATAIYRHFLGRGKERFNEVAPVIKKKAHWWDETPGASVGKTTVAAEAPTRLDRAITPPTVPTFTAARVPTFTPNGKSVAQPPATGRPAPTAQEMPTANGRTTAESETASAGLASRLREWRGLLWNRRVLLRYWIPAITVFVLVMGGITAFELVAGKPVSAAVWGKTGSGTTVGNVFSGGSSSTKNKNTTNPSGQPSSGASTSTGQSSTAPSSAASPSPSPSVSSSPAATPTDSSNAAASASAGADDGADSTSTGSNAGNNG